MDAAVCFHVYDFGEIIPAWSSEEAPHFNRQGHFTSESPDPVRDLRKPEFLRLIRLITEIINRKPGPVFHILGFKVQFIPKFLDQFRKIVQLFNDLFSFPFLRPGKIMQANDPNTLIPELTIGEAIKLFEEKVIAGGMIPKVECCIDAIHRGVERVIIMDGRVPHSILMEILTDEGAGTMVYGEETELCQN